MTTGNGLVFTPPAGTVGPEDLTWGVWKYVITESDKAGFRYSRFCPTNVEHAKLVGPGEHAIAAGFIAVFGSGEWVIKGATSSSLDIDGDVEIDTMRLTTIFGRPPAR